MKALSLRQPWLAACGFLGKPIENRDWPLPADLTVPFDCYFHASRTIESDDVDDLREDGLEDWMLVRGALGIVVTVTGCITKPRNALDSTWWTGPFAFTFSNVRILPTPIPWKGVLKFFDVPDAYAADAVPFARIDRSRIAESWTAFQSTHRIETPKQRRAREEREAYEVAMGAGSCP